MKNKRFLWIVVGLIVSAAGFVGCQAMEGKIENLPVDEWVQGALDKVNAPQDGLLTASGSIQADSIRIASELGGRIAEIHVTKGQAVRAGEALVVLDSTQVLDKITEAQAAVAAAEAELALAQAGPRAEQAAAARAMLSLAEAQRDGAMSAWENAQDMLDHPQDLDAEIVQARTRVKLAEQAAFLAQAQLEKEKLVAQQKREGSKEREAANLQVKAFEEALSAARADMTTAQTALDWLWAIRRQPLGLVAQVYAAKGRYQVAEGGVAVSQASLDDLLAGPTDEEIAVAEANVRLARSQVQILEANLTKFTLTNPVDGIVLNQTLQVGELAAPAATILNVADLSNPTLTVYVPVDSIGEVQLGQAVQVAVDSFPSRTFDGEVFHISDDPEFTPRNVATKEERLNTVYAVEIRLDNSEGLLKPGMPADAAFLPASGDQG
jgi:membrane fusion protein YbhG